MESSLRGREQGIPVTLPCGKVTEPMGRERGTSPQPCTPTDSSGAAPCSLSQRLQPVPAGARAWEAAAFGTSTAEELRGQNICFQLIQDPGARGDHLE